MEGDEFPANDEDKDKKMEWVDKLIDCFCDKYKMLDHILVHIKQENAV